MIGAPKTRLKSERRSRTARVGRVAALRWLPADAAGPDVVAAHDGVRRRRATIAARW
jgi:hypothetical protein